MSLTMAELGAFAGLGKNYGATQSRREAGQKAYEARAAVARESTARFVAAQRAGATRGMSQGQWTRMDRYRTARNGHYAQRGRQRVRIGEASMDELLAMKPKAKWERRVVKERLARKIRDEVGVGKEMLKSMINNRQLDARLRRAARRELGRQLRRDRRNADKAAKERRRQERIAAARRRKEERRRKRKPPPSRRRPATGYMIMKDPSGKIVGTAGNVPGDWKADLQARNKIFQRGGTIPSNTTGDWLADLQARNRGYQRSATGGSLPSSSPVIYNLAGSEAAVLSGLG